MYRLVKSALPIYGVNIVNGLLGLAVVPVGLRCLGVEGYGLFSIYGVLQSYVALSDLGVGKNLLRSLAAEKTAEARADAMGTALAIYLLLAAALLLLIPALAYAVSTFLFGVPQALQRTVQWIVVFAVVEYVLGIPGSMMQAACVAEERFDGFSRYTLAAGLNRYSMLFAGFLIFGTPVGVAGLQAGRKLIDLLLARRLMGGVPMDCWRPRWAKAQVRAMLSESTSLSMVQMLNLSTIHFGSVLVNAFFGLHTLGIYRAVYDLASKVFFFGNTFGLVIFPRFAKGSGEDFLSRHLNSVLNASWSFYALVSSVAILLAPLILPRMGLPDASTQHLFFLLCIGLCINAHSILSSEAMQAGRRYVPMAWVCTLTLVSTAGVFLLLRNYLGILSIGIAWVVGQVVFAFSADAFIVGSRTAQVSHWRSIVFKSVALMPALLLAGSGLMALPRMVQFASTLSIISVFVYSVSHLVGQSRRAATS